MIKLAACIANKHMFKAGYTRASFRRRVRGEFFSRERWRSSRPQNQMEQYTRGRVRCVIAAIARRDAGVCYYAANSLRFLLAGRSSSTSRYMGGYTRTFAIRSPSVSFFLCAAAILNIGHYHRLLSTSVQQY